VVGTKTRLDLWQNYARCHFDYFLPTIMICDQSNKFGSLFTKSLKKALGLPIHLPNKALLRVVGVPSMKQIAGHHVVNITTAIRNRFSCYPSSLNELAATLSHAAEEYKTLSTLEPIRAITQNSFYLDLFLRTRERVRT